MQLQPPRRVAKRPVARTGRTVDLNSKARMYAKQQGLPPMQVRVARLVPHPQKPKQRVWQFPVDRKLLMIADVITVLCEARAGHPEDGEFLTLQIPKWFIEQPLLPLFQDTNSSKVTLHLSADEADFLDVLDLPKPLPLREFAVS
jgi:hypothetical protein